MNGPPAPATGSWAGPGWGLRRRIAVALIAGGVALLGVVGLSGTVLTEVQDAQTRVLDNYFAAQGMSNRRFVSWLDMETAVRGYALTKNRSSLQPMRDALTTGAEPDGPHPSAAQERSCVPGRPRRVQRRRRSLVPRVGVAAIATINATGALPPAEAERGQVLFNQIRTRFDAYSAQLRSNRADAVRSLRWRTDLLFVAVVVSALGAVAVAALLWWLLRRWVSDPAEALAREARKVSAGDLNHAVRVDGPPEFVALAADMDAMRRRLVDQIAEVEAGRREIAEAQARLEGQAAALEKSNRDLEQFAYVASHDLQEPLRKVASFCQMLQRRYAGQLDARADQYITYAVDGALRMQQLINALLEFSRVGRAAIPQTVVDLQECLELAMSNLEVSQRESGAEITWDPLPSVRGEPALLTQLLQNLLANAIKFRSEAAPRAHIGVRRERDHWQFSCEDNGIGIESRYAERVFLIFQQLHTRETYSGTGIGLALCRRIVEYHGGMIWVEQRPGPGTMIRWTLPVVRGVPDVDAAGNGERQRSRDESHGEQAGVGDSEQVAATEGSGQDDPARDCYASCSSRTIRAMSLLVREASRTTRWSPSPSGRRATASGAGAAAPGRSCRDAHARPHPADLNPPRMDGREVTPRSGGRPAAGDPIVVLTTSRRRRTSWQLRPARQRLRHKPVELTASSRSSARSSASSVLSVTDPPTETPPARVDPRIWSARRGSPTRTPPQIAGHHRKGGRSPTAGGPRH